MRAEIIATGTELLSGGVLDTNSLFLAEELMLCGIETAFKTVVGDDEKDMEETIRRALARVDAVIITGGIGPTEDDITRKVIAKIVKRRLVLNEEALKAIHVRLAGRGKEHATSNDRQALLPAGVRMLANPVGIAPGFYLDEEDTVPGGAARRSERNGGHVQRGTAAGARRALRQPVCSSGAGSCAPPACPSPP